MREPLPGSTRAATSERESGVEPPHSKTRAGEFRYLFVREKSKWKTSGVVEIKPEGPVADVGV